MAPKAAKKPKAKSSRSPSRSPRAGHRASNSSAAAREPAVTLEAAVACLERPAKLEAREETETCEASVAGVASSAAAADSDVSQANTTQCQPSDAVLSSAVAASVEESCVEKDPDSPIEKSLLAAFSALDANQDGFVSEEDFAAVLVHLGYPEAGISAAFQAAGANANGFVDYANFLSWITAAPEEIQSTISSLIAVNGRRGKIVWDGRPDHQFLQIMWLDSGALEMLSVDKVFPGEKTEIEKVLGKTSSIDDAWQEFQNKFDSLTKNLISAITTGGVDGMLEGAGYDDDKELPEPDAKWKPQHDEVCARLKAAEFIEPDSKLFWHGRLYEGPAVQPRTIWSSDEPPRDDHYCPEWLTASEFQDVPDVAEWKIAHLAKLLRMSRKTVLYTGAGISAAVVGQAARSGIHTVGFMDSPLKAPPTFTHWALGVLGVQGLIHSWVQQNHDGLPQKAGFPQELINEVHGSWYDPSNPVVKYSGSLRRAEFQWMVDDTATADLVIVFGSSLGGLNADRLPKRAADRSLAGRVLGTVCINLQQTPHDGMMSLRLFGTSDDILKSLLKELELDREALTPTFEESNCVLVPYDAEGSLLTSPESKKMWLNLNTGVEVRLTEGHNIQGAKQDKYLHIGASEAVTFMACRRAPAEPVGFVLRRDDEICAFVLDIAGVDMNLGLWWLDAARRGAIKRLPVVNLHPQYEGETPEGPKEVKVDPRAWWEKGESVIPVAKEVGQRKLLRSASDDMLGGAKLKRALSA